MRMRVPLAFLAPALLAVLAGCVSPEDLRREDEAACASYGFQPGTTDFAACLQRESLSRRYSLSGPPAYGWYGPGWYRPTPGMIW